MVKIMFDKIDYREVESNAMYCVHCGLCRQVLPSEIKNDRFGDICPIGTKFMFEAYYAPGRNEIARALLRNEFSYEESPKLLEIIYSCLTCGSCDITCRYCTTLGRVQPGEITEAIRAKMVKDGVGPLPRHKKWGQSIISNKNPYEEEHSNRLKWLKGEKPPEQAETLYFVGCTSSYKTQEIASATYAVMKKIGMEVMISPEEYCCGSPLFRTGQLDIAEQVMNHNIELIENSGVKKVVFSCPGCLRTFKKDYPKFAGPLNFELKHISQEIVELIDKGQIELDKLNLTVTYHDPCHLGRHLWPESIYEEPRKILNAIPELQFKEMERNRDGTWCCGAGGGVKSGFPETSLWTVKKRLEEAVETTGAQALVTACPFCINNFKEGVKKENMSLKIYDLMEIMSMVLK